MTFRGVTSARPLDGAVLVCDIGGGSTELLAGGPGRRATGPPAWTWAACACASASCPPTRRRRSRSPSSATGRAAQFPADRRRAS